MSSDCQTTVQCQVQNRLGALDRVLGAFTHRGIVPRHIESTCDDHLNTLQVSVNFECADTPTLEKLVKFLQKQVYVIEVRGFRYEDMAETTAPANVTELFNAESTKRRTAHVHNA